MKESFEYRGAYISQIINSKTFLPCLVIRYNNHVSIVPNNHANKIKIMDEEIYKLKNKSRLDKIKKICSKLEIK